MNSTPLIFVGFELTEQVDAYLNDCSERDKIYLEDPAYLETVTVDDCRYIGKRAKDGIAVDRLEDVARSVVSLLARVSGNWQQTASEAVIIAAEETVSAPEEPSDNGDSNAEEQFDYTTLVE